MFLDDEYLGESSGGSGMAARRQQRLGVAATRSGGMAPAATAAPVRDRSPKPLDAWGALVDFLLFAFFD